MNSAKNLAIEASISPRSKQKEMDIRNWIAKKESVCPYAPGLARFVHMPAIEAIKMEHVYYFAQELKAFYDDKINGKRVGRWMLMPHEEWESHEAAHTYSERIFWLLNAAYYHLMRDKKSLNLALNQALPGFDRGFKSDIMNPIIGKQPKRNADTVPAKSLFYSALSPLYKSKKFYRYSPHALIPLVYASEFEALSVKHPKVTENVTFTMAACGLREILGDELELDLTDFRKELPHWGAIVDRSAAIMRAQANGLSSKSPEVMGCPASNLSYFRLCNPKLIDAFYQRHQSILPTLSRLVDISGVRPKDLIKAAFAGSGLYVVPEYPEVNGYQATYH